MDWKNELMFYHDKSTFEYPMEVNSTYTLTNFSILGIAILRLFSKRGMG